MTEDACPTCCTRTAGSSRRRSSRHANVNDELVRRGRARTGSAFWAKQAERLAWDTTWTEVLDWSNPPFAKWFVGGKLNAAYNCVDRHVEAGDGDQVAYHWVGEPEATPATITYAELQGRWSARRRTR